MKKDFNVKTFVEEYIKAANTLGTSDKDKFLRTKLKTEKYLPFADKVGAADRIVRNTSFAMVNDDGMLKQSGVVKIDTPIRHVLIVMTIVDRYTNIEVNFKDIMPDFDALNSNGLIEIIAERIGDKEISEFNTVIAMVSDDFMTNTYQFKNYIDSIIHKIAELASKYSPVVNAVVDKLDNMTEEEAEKLFGTISRITKLVK